MNLNVTNPGHAVVLADPQLEVKAGATVPVPTAVALSLMRQGWLPADAEAAAAHAADLADDLEAAVDAGLETAVPSRPTRRARRTPEGDPK